MIYVQSKIGLKFSGQTSNELGKCSVYTLIRSILDSIRLASDWTRVVSDSLKPIINVSQTVIIKQTTNHYSWWRCCWYTDIDLTKTGQKVVVWTPVNFAIAFENKFLLESFCYSLIKYSNSVTTEKMDGSLDTTASNTNVRIDSSDVIMNSSGEVLLVTQMNKIVTKNK